MYEPHAAHRDTCTVPVPSEMNIGMLIGTGGSNIKHIEKTVGDGLRVKYVQVRKCVTVLSIYYTESIQCINIILVNTHVNT